MDLEAIRGHVHELTNVVAALRMTTEMPDTADREPWERAVTAAVVRANRICAEMQEAAGVTAADRAHGIGADPAAE